MLIVKMLNYFRIFKFDKVLSGAAGAKEQLTADEQELQKQLEETSNAFLQVDIKISFFSYRMKERNVMNMIYYYFI